MALTPNSPPQNPELVGAIFAVAENDNQQTRTNLYEAMLKSIFLLPVAPGSFAETWVNYQPDNPVQFFMTRTEDGEGALPVFTDFETFHAAGVPTANFVAIHAGDMFNLVVENAIKTVHINPGGQIGGYITEGEITALSQGLIPQTTTSETISRDTPMMIGSPSEPASEMLLEAIQSVLGTHQQVDEGYIFVMTSGAEKPQLTLGVRFAPNVDEDSIRQLMPRLVQQLTPSVDPHRGLNFLVLSDGLYESVRGITSPVFLR
jgi:hypothetical protein